MSILVEFGDPLLEPPIRRAITDGERLDIGDCDSPPVRTWEALDRGLELINHLTSAPVCDSARLDFYAAPRVHSG